MCYYSYANIITTGIGLLQILLLLLGETAKL